MIGPALNAMLKTAEFRTACRVGDCVEVAMVEVVAVRDSKAGDESPVLWFSRTEWDEFTAGVTAGKFDFS